jgi:multidrug resistance efflux pump
MTSPVFNPRALKAYHRAGNSGWSPRNQFQINRRLTTAILIALISSIILMSFPLPERSLISGILVQRPAKTVSARQSGHIVHINYSEGSVLERGDILAEIIPEFTSDQNQRKIDRIKHQIQLGEQLMRNWQEDHKLLRLSHISRSAKLKAHRLANAAILNVESARLQTLQENLRKVQQLGRPKLLTSLEWQRLSDPLMQQTIRIAQTQIRQEDLDFELKQAVISLDRQNIQLQSKLSKQRSELTQLEQELDHRLPHPKLVRAPWAGRLAQRFIQEGDLVQTEDKLFDIVSASPPLSAQLFLTDNAQAVLKPGDTINLKLSGDSHTQPRTVSTIIQKIGPIKVWTDRPSHLEQLRFEAIVSLPKPLEDSRGEAFLFAPGAPVFAWIKTGESTLIERLYRIIHSEQKSPFEP